MAGGVELRGKPMDEDIEVLGKVKRAEISGHVAIGVNGESKDCRAYVSPGTEQRWLACWNACHRIPTNQLTSGSVAKLVEAANKVACELEHFGGGNGPWEVEIAALREALTPFERK